MTRSLGWNPYVTSRQSSTQSRLLRVIAIVIIPAMLLCAYLSVRYAEAERRVIEAQRLDAVNNLTLLLVGEVAGGVPTANSFRRSRSPPGPASYQCRRQCLLHP